MLWDRKSRNRHCANGNSVAASIKQKLKNIVFILCLFTALSFGPPGLHTWIGQHYFPPRRDLVFDCLWREVFCLAINGAALTWALTDFTW